MREICPRIGEWKAKNIGVRIIILYCLVGNFEPNILKDLSYITFDNLIFLDIAGNEIHSLENLRYLNAPALENLTLSITYSIQLIMI